MWELGADGYDGRARRTRPTFVDSPESPLIGDAWTKATFRQRVSAWYAAFSSGNPVAGAIYAATIVKSAVYLAFFYYLLRDADAPLFGELNAKRFLLYNLLGACPEASDSAPACEDACGQPSPPQPTRRRLAVSTERSVANGLFWQAT
jgi:hypothetical protein